MSAEKLRLWSVSLGCPKNRVDTEHLLGSLGLEIEHVEEIAESEMVFINTCAFIEPAVRESVRTILQAIEDCRDLAVKPFFVVAGCLVGRYGVQDLQVDLPEVDLWLESATLADWPELLCKAYGRGCVRPGRLLSTGPSYAWLKIGEGCRHHCAFCTIPAIRGSLRSVPEKVLLDESKQLLDCGVRELILVAQDVTAWGSDMGCQLTSLIRKLVRLDNLAWLRLLYLYPAGLNDAFLTLMRDCGEPLLPYFDIPLQHCAAPVLKRMGRPFARDPRYLLDKIHSKVPQAVLRTTFIVGFPGETDEHFAALCALVAEGHFLNLGVFTYQAEEGTSAAQLPDQVPQNVRLERRDHLLRLQQDVSREALEEYVGKRMQVLVDSPNPDWPGLYNGRVWFQAPEVDGQTYVSGEGVTSGRMVVGEVVESNTYDLTVLV